MVTSEIPNNLKYPIYIVYIILLSMGCTKQEGSSSVPGPKALFELVPYTKEVFAGDNIEIRLKSDIHTDVFLIISNSYGSSVVSPTIKEGSLFFNLPNVFKEKSGICTWALVFNEKVYVSGTVTIRPNPKKGTSIASYLGPRSISAGEHDFSMFVISPTDAYDNPLADSTAVDVFHQFGKTITTEPIQLKNLIAWTSIYSTKKSGRILVSAACNEAQSKEFTTIVYPSNATNFNIRYTRNHTYADGNQILRFSTDVIKDVFGNIVSDGTLVSFVITNSEGIKLYTTGMTINGMAKADVLHPNKAEKWNVTAYITGAAKSKPITVGFNSALQDYNVHYSKNSRTITVAPLKSFMGQLIPDGLPVQLTIKKLDGTLVEVKKATSRLGKASFTLLANFFPKGDYIISIAVSDVHKTKTIHLE